MYTRSLRALTGLCLLLFAAVPLQAESLRLGWHPSPEPTVRGYVLHYGTEPGVYTHSVDVGIALWRQVDNLDAATTYYFTVEAYAADGSRSPRSNVIAVTTDDPQDTSPGGETYYLTEGATGNVFGMDIAVANPNLVTAPITVRFRTAGGDIGRYEEVLEPLSQRTIRVNELAGLEDQALSSSVESGAGVPLLVERSMVWPRSAPTAGHAEAAVRSAETRWYFAEGQHGYGETSLLLFNPGTVPSTATVTFYREAASPVLRSYTVAPGARLTVASGSVSELAGRTFGMQVEASHPLFAERSVYFPKATWRGGHASAGVAAPSTQWHHAEGVTGTDFDTYLLLVNPNPTRAKIVLRYLLDTGETVTTTKYLKEQRRLTVNVEKEATKLGSASFAIAVSSDIPVLSERSMYWHANGSTEWLEGHNAFGAPRPATRWGLADGRVGGALGYDTRIVLANPSSAAAPVTITFLRGDGSTVVKTFTVGARKRQSVHVNTMVRELKDESFGVIVDSTSGTPIVVERVTYFSGGRGGTSVLGSVLPKE